MTHLYYRKSAQKKEAAAASKAPEKTVNDEVVKHKCANRSFTTKFKNISSLTHQF